MKSFRLVSWREIGKALSRSPLESPSLLEQNFSFPSLYARTRRWKKKTILSGWEREREREWEWCSFFIAVPTATILGGPDLYVGAGSTINLTCAIHFSSEPPAYIFWYYNEHVLSYDSPRGGVSVITEKGGDVTTSWLLIQTAQPSDSGEYSCKPSNANTASIKVHVLNGKCLQRRDIAPWSHIRSSIVLDAERRWCKEKKKRRNKEREEKMEINTRNKWGKIWKRITFASAITNFSLDRIFIPILRKKKKKKKEKSETK